MPATYEPIQTYTLSANTSSITFSSIPATYTDLILIANSGQTTADSYYGIRFNGDSTGNYSNTQMLGNASTIISNANNNTTIGYVHSTNEDSVADTLIISIPNYQNTNVYKTALSRGNSKSYRVVLSLSMWRSKSAITSISLSGGYNLLSGSTFTLYGIKAA
jgi:hypothetical protein